MTRSYQITAAHPPEGGLWIAGRRIRPGQTTVVLSDAEAAADLLAGAIAPIAPPDTPAEKRPRKPV